MLTGRGVWEEDTRLRVECYQPSRARDCCQIILVESEGEAGRRYQDRMGVYTAHSLLSGRIVYKHVQNTVEQTIE